MGNSYYFIFDPFPPVVALRYAVSLHNALAKANQGSALSVRMVLAIGDVKSAGDQIRGNVTEKAERLLKDRALTAYVESRPKNVCLAMTKLFHATVIEEVTREETVAEELESLDLPECMVAGFGEGGQLVLAEAGASVLVNKGLALCRLGRLEGAVAVFDEVVN